jgi:uncharacterized membrane protein YkvA (DUF1232 family)
MQTESKDIRIMKRTNIINYDVLWDRISSFASKAGRVTTRPVLLLFYVMKSKETPWEDKLLVFSTLSYVVFPVDILDAKRLPIIGWLDEIASLSVTYQKMCKNITPEIEAKVDAILDKWFPEYTPYEIIKDVK